MSICLSMDFDGDQKRSSDQAELVTQSHEALATASLPIS